MISFLKSIDLRHWIGFWVLIFSVTVVSFRGYAGAAIVLLITALFVAAFKRPKLSFLCLNNYERIFIALFISWYGVQLLGVLYQPPGYEFENLRSHFKALDHPSRWLLLLPVFFLFRSYLIDWRFVAIGLSIGACVSTGIAHYQVYILGADRAWGGATHPIPYAELMVAIDLILWMFMIYAWDKGYKILSTFILLGSLVAFYGSLLSVTRGAWLAYLAMILIWVFYTLSKSLRNYRYLFSTPVLLRFIFAAFVFWGVSQTDQYSQIEARTVSTLDAISNDGLMSADKQRAIIVEDSISVFKRFPFGIGTGNFSAIKVDSVLNTPSGYRWTHAHNQFLNILVQNGIQGLIIFIALILFTLFVFLKSFNARSDLVRVYAAVGMMLVFSYAVFGLTQAVFKHKDTLMFFVFFLYLFFGQIQLLNRKQGKVFV